MQNKILNIQPQAVGTSVANILNCNITAVTGPVGMTATQPYLIIKHIRVNNKTASAITLNLYKGATAGSAAGTEFAANGYSIPANQAIDIYYGQARFDAADFLTGNASATGLTLNIDAEIGFS